MQNKVFIQITDYKEWCKRNKVGKGQRVFIIKGPYNDVRKALLNRGWFENKDVESPVFDFKWCLKMKDINVETLERY